MFNNYRIIGKNGKTHMVGINEDQILFFTKSYENKGSIEIPAFTSVKHIKPGQNHLYYAISNKIGNKLSLIQTLEGSYGEIDGMFQRIKEIINQVPFIEDTSYVDSIMSEVQELRGEIERVSQESLFNNLPIMVNQLKIYVYGKWIYTFDSLQPITITLDTIDELISDYQTLSLLAFKQKINNYYSSELNHRKTDLEMFRSELGGLQNILENLISALVSMYENTAKDSGTLIDELLMKCMYSEGVFSEFGSVCQRLKELFVQISNDTLVIDKRLQAKFEINDLFDMFQILNDLSFMPLGTSIGLTLPNSDYEIYSTQYTEFFTEAEVLRHAVNDSIDAFVSEQITYEVFAEQMTEHIQAIDDIVDNIDLYRGSVSDVQNTLEILADIDGIADTDLIGRCIELLENILTYPDESDCDTIIGSLNTENKILKYYYDLVTFGTGKTLNTPEIIDEIVDEWTENRNINNLQVLVNNSMSELVENLSQIYEKDNINAVYSLKTVSGDLYITRDNHLNNRLNIL